MLENNENKQKEAGVGRVFIKNQLIDSFNLNRDDARVEDRWDNEEGQIRVETANEVHQLDQVSLYKTFIRCIWQLLLDFGLRIECTD